MSTADSKSLCDWSETSDLLIDVDKLLVLVEAKPELYDITRKDYHNQEVIAKAWHSIGKSLNVSSAACKHKWHTLRSSYGRYLRDLKKRSGGSSRKRKKWHLAEAMDFLFPYMSLPKKTNSSVKQNSEEGDQSLTGQRGEENVEDLLAVELVEDDSIDEAGITATSSNASVIEELNQKNKNVIDPAQEVAQHMAAYFQSMTRMPTPEEHPMLLFFKGLMPDIIKLPSNSQRRLKTDILNAVNFYVDMEENQLSHHGFDRPPSNHSAFGSNSSD